ncbi:hypothetical protein M8J75_009326 [Diaphorina citri]|nr:hypothetical protein M8J75_009326 [Diaphorina citri]
MVTYFCVQKISAQERLKNAKEIQLDEPQASGQRREDPTCSFLPAFATRTPTTAVPPLMETAVASPVPSSADPNSGDAPILSGDLISTENVTSVNEADVLPNKLNDGSQVTKAVIEPLPLGSAPPTDSNESIDMDMDIVPEKGKKRALTQSPPPQDNEKKVCVQKNELEPICPLIEKHEPSVDPLVFIDLIQELKGAINKKKMDIIKDNYDMDPQLVTDVLEKVVNEQSMEIRVKNRLKNLRKTILNLMKESPPADPTDSMDLPQADD